MSITENVWLPVCQPPAITENDIHVWKVSLTEDAGKLDQIKQWLSKEEILRANKFYSKQLQDRFIYFRGTLRHLLGSYLTIDPEKVDFVYNDSGKPFVKGDLQFNISHSQDLGVFVFSWRQQVGVDVEYKRPISDIDDICRRFLSAKDCEYIFSFSQQDRLEAFYNVWVKKEAYTKALGDRLFEVLAKLKTENQHNHEEPQVVFGTFFTAKDYASALAVVGKMKTLKYFNYSP